MKTISLEALLQQIRKYVSGRCDYDEVRNYVFSRYESEDDFVVEDDADDVLTVLAPYVESEEAFGDKSRGIRLRRLVNLFQVPPKSCLATVAVFALNFEEIQELLRKREANVISNTVFCEQLRKLSPAQFDLNALVRWAKSHTEESEPLPEKVG